MLMPGSWLSHIGRRKDCHLWRSRAQREPRHLSRFWGQGERVVEKSCLKHYWRLLRTQVLLRSGSWNKVSFKTRQVFLVWHFPLAALRTYGRVEMVPSGGWLRDRVAQYPKTARDHGSLDWGHWRWRGDCCHEAGADLVSRTGLMEPLQGGHMWVHGTQAADS